ncbi:MAG TPA: Type 1 glutamine amidotransferase-like domain-containing protein, partial [Woeseiaceae bacterium]|nr:Type 1 glutamine amidotransferase-like domain-containing protein [Woeseiaceae bacterium]
MSPSNDHRNDAERGYIIPIGGGEEKAGNPDILGRFVEICGGRRARIAVIPTASELKETGRNYEKLFKKLGVDRAQALHILTRQDCQEQEHLDYIEKCDGVFLTGGN